MNTPTDLRSPYEPPTADLSQSPVLAPQHGHSAAPKVFGILSIIFASLVLLSSALGLLATAASSMVKNMGNMSPDADKAAEVAAVMGPMVKVYQGIGGPLEHCIVHDHCIAVRRIRGDETYVVH